MAKIVITTALRSCIGNFGGSLSPISASDLGSNVIRHILAKSNLQAEQIDQVIMGQVLNAGQGQNPARQAAIKAGLPHETTAFGVNQVCGSGLLAVITAAQQITQGDARMIIAGGQESMSQAQHCISLRNPVKMGNACMVDSMIHDGLTDAFHNYHMGITAENIAKKYNINRDTQDQFAVLSQNKAEAAQKTGKFQDEIVPTIVPFQKGEKLVETDEFIRHGVSYEALSKLRPAFIKDTGTVTAGNSSGLNDGAAAVLLMQASDAEQYGLEPMAQIESWAMSGVDPAFMGLGPVSAARKALAKAGWGVDDLHRIEANEAFAAQAIAVNKEMDWDSSLVNVNGGAIAIGHPIGASGARILVTLLHEMKRSGARRGLATLCIGGGMGIAMCLSAL